MISFGNASGPVLNIDVIKMIQPKGIYFTRPVMGQYLSTKDEIAEGSEKLFEKIMSGQVKVKIFKKYKLKYSLASDLTDVCEKLGIWIEKSMYGKKYFGIDRSTFMIDSKGKLFKQWNKVKVKDHVEEVLEIAKHCP